jgi:Na+-transporting NADH:ubiquinone oxidoreductase subunit NqrF
MGIIKMLMILCSVSLFSQTKYINFDKLELRIHDKKNSLYSLKVINKTNVSYNEKNNLKYISSPDGRMFKCDKCKYEFKNYAVKKNNKKSIKKVINIDDLFSGNYKPVDVYFGASGFYIEKDYYQIMQRF